MALTSYPNELAALSSPAVVEPATVKTGEKHSYGQILKSSALVGGSSVLKIAIGIVRTKAMAILLGPAGFGLFGLFGSISDLSQNIAGMGVNSSGVRQIAEAVGSSDTQRIARTAAVLRRTSIVLGALGAVLLAAFSKQVARLTFGSTERTSAVALLSIAVLLTLVSGGQGALIQGMRRITDLAKMNVLGAFFGLCTSIPLVYFFRQQGIVPSLIAVAATTVMTSWWYSSKIEIQVLSVTVVEVRNEASALLKLGSAFMVSGMMTMGVAYAVRIIVLRQVGVDATGLYQSAWTLGGLYVGFILQAMGADFYPRLTASANNNEDCNRLVNEQTLVGLLLAGPGVLATLTFAPLVIALFYSVKFGAAVTVLRWICLGVTLQVVSWPMGFIIVAKGKQNLFVASEVAWTVVAISLAWVCVKRFGLDGAGIAFFVSYLFHAFMSYLIARTLTGFRWSNNNIRTGSSILSLVALMFCGCYLLPLLWAASIGGIVVIATGLYSIRTLATWVAFDSLPNPVRRVLRIVGLDTRTKKVLSL
jgi:O-antigen/teichoic acid export membrane protein